MAKSPCSIHWSLLSRPLYQSTLPRHRLVDSYPVNSVETNQASPSLRRRCRKLQLLPTFHPRSVEASFSQLPFLLHLPSSFFSLLSPSTKTSTALHLPTIACYLLYYSSLLYSLFTYRTINLLSQRYCRRRWLFISAMANPSFIHHSIPSSSISHQLSYPHPSRLHRSISTSCISPSSPSALASSQPPAQLLSWA
jgi:hypothetical protein